MPTLFENMTEEEIKAWWVEEIKKFLQHQQLENAEIEWIAYTHNMVFKVTHADNRYILKTGTGASREIRILQHLGDSAIPALPKMVQKDNGERIVGTVVQPFGFVIDQGQWTNTMLIEFINGVERNPDDVSLVEMTGVGKFLADFHNASPDYLESIKQGYQYSTLDAEGLFGKRGVYRLDNEAQQVFTDEQIRVMDAVAEKVKSAMDELGTGESVFGLIHGDLLLKNILFYEGEVRALDFEYCGWGYYLYDLTPILWQLKPQARYPVLEQALWDGYTSIRPLSNRHRELLETFIAGRQVASMRWVAANRHNPAYQSKVEGILAQRTAELQGFLETGILKRQ